MFVIILHISGFQYSFVKKIPKFVAWVQLLVVIKKLDLVTDVMETLGNTLLFSQHAFADR